ncbi:MAG: hypothetical protein AABW99_00500 [archaeon]
MELDILNGKIAKQDLSRPKPKIGHHTAGGFRRGQASIEFLLILVVSLLYIVAIIQPNADIASNAMNDTANLAKLRASADKLVNAAQYVSISGAGTRQTIEIVIPPQSKIYCVPAAPPSTNFAGIGFSYLVVPLDAGLEQISARVPEECKNNADDDLALDLDPDADKKCTKELDAGASFSCSPSEVNTGVQGAIFIAKVDKIGSETKVTFGQSG